MEFHSDAPITSKNEDKLDRDKFAKNLANAIKSFPVDESLSVGLIGKWGTGKSSIINLTKNHLDDDNLILIEFNPWYFSTQNNLYQQFFNLISSEIEKREFGDKLWIKKKFAQIKQQYDKLPKVTRENKKLTQYFKEKFYSLHELRNSDVINAYYNQIKSNSLVNFNAPGIGYSYNFDDSLKEYNSVSYLKTKCEEYFQDLGYKFLIIIDDIDRMNSIEIEQIFLLVKSLANFPNFIYLLSFDKEVVVNSLNDVPEDFRNDFIEKIIQIPIVVPEISDYSLNNYIQHEIKELYYEYLKDNFRGEDEFKKVSHIIGYFIKNIRDLKRYMNAIEFYSTFMRELNINDMFILIAIHTFEYEIYLKIKDELKVFILDKFLYFQDENEIKNRLTKFLDDSYLLLKKINSAELDSTLGTLFPILNEKNLKLKKIILGSDIEDKECRISSSSHFNKYFTLTIENNEISSVEMDKFLKLDNPDEILDILLDYYEMGNFKSFISSFWQFCGRMSDENAKYYIHALMKFGDKFSLDNDLPDYWERICICLFKKINSNQESFRIIKNGISDENIFLITRFTYLLSYYYRHCGDYSGELPEEYAILDDNDLFELEKLVLEKLRDLISNKELLMHKNLGSILYFWCLIENEEEVKNYLKCNIHDENDKLVIKEAIDNHNDLRNLINIAVLFCG